jgi:TPP-dependent pyruvate/acetoin dehydrogenase alpha subunit
VLTLSRAGKIPGVALPILGGEATEVGACIGLQPDDSLATSQPKLAAHVVKDTPLHRVFAELFARHKQPPAQPTSNGAGALRIIPPASSLTGQLDIAAGVAYAYRSLGKANVVVALADDGLAALGFWHEAASLASRHRLPIVFIVENCAQSHANGTSVVQSDEDLRDRAEAYGIPGITVDGNDIVAVWRVTQESIHGALHEEAQAVAAGMERQAWERIPGRLGCRREFPATGFQVALNLCGPAPVMGARP